MLPLQQFSSACPRDFKLNSVAESSAAVITLNITNAQGNPVNLVEAVGGTGETLPDGYTMEYRIREAHWANQLNSLEVQEVDLTSGVVSVDMSATDTKFPGTFLAEFLIIDQDGVRRFSEMRYLEITPTINWLREPGIPTVAEVRLYLRDTPADNTLLDDVEFSAAEVMAALRRPIDIWNETTPDVIRYTAATFPWREHWMQAAVGYLMKTASYHYFRNELSYSSGGLSAADKDKGQTYMKLAEMQLEEFKSWMMRKKVEINMNMGYGTLGSPYGL
jgi:hypothetical protein